MYRHGGTSALGGVGRLRPPAIRRSRGSCRRVSDGRPPAAASRDAQVPRLESARLSWHLGSRGGRRSARYTIRPSRPPAAASRDAQVSRLGSARLSWHLGSRGGRRLARCAMRSIAADVFERCLSYCELRIALGRLRVFGLRGVPRSRRAPPDPPFLLPLRCLVCRRRGSRCRRSG